MHPPAAFTRNTRTARAAAPRTRHAGLLALSAAVAAYAMWAHHKAEQAQRDHAPSGRFMHIDGVRLHYLEMGSGPPVAMLHGNGVHMGDLLASGVPQQLAQSCRVVLFDRPGFGHSLRPRDRLWTPHAQAAVLHRALLALGMDRPVVLGHSLGALVALALALDYPANLAGLVLVGGYYYPQVHPLTLAFGPVATPILGDAMRYTVSSLSARLALKRMVRGAFAPQDPPPDYLAQLAQELLVRPSQLRADAEDLVYMLPAARAMAPRYAGLQLPVAVMAGARDRVVDTDEHARRLAAELPASRLHVAPGIGHMLHHAAPHAVVEMLEAVMADGRQPRPLGTPGAVAAR
ncbi:alpha/beta hydrolase [Ramlibacter sp. AN1015]|uniref:alpha/beta fold hydrolase n=1 Tax=Ramlibacter sp. AN1015 TaxID=3133428 RepID=UPI0030BA8086